MVATTTTTTTTATAMGAASHTSSHGSIGLPQPSSRPTTTATTPASADGGGGGRFSVSGCGFEGDFAGVDLTTDDVEAILPADGTYYGWIFSLLCNVHLNYLMF